MSDSEQRMVCECMRCRHRWVTRLPGRPNACARCKITGWWRTARSMYVAVNAKPRGRYPEVHNLEVGQSVTLPWNFDPVGSPGGGLPSKRLNGNMKRAIDNIERRYGKTFERRGHGAGLDLTRLT